MFVDEVEHAGTSGIDPQPGIRKRKRRLADRGAGRLAPRSCRVPIRLPLSPGVATLSEYGSSGELAGMRPAAVVALLLCPVLYSQVNSRVAEIEAARDAKAEELEPEELTKVEDRMLWIKESKVLERFAAGVYGLRVKLGGMATGEGFALGPEYLRQDLARGKIIVRGAAQVSAKRSVKIDAQLLAPSFSNGRFFTDLYAVRHNYGGLHYHGPGPDSEKTGRSNFRYEDAAFDGLLGVNLGRYLKLGGTAGHLRVNVGPGRDERFASAEQIYSPDQAPGIDHQTNFLRYGSFLQLDYRDAATGPRSGGNYLFQYDYYSDRKLKLHDFHRLDMELQQHIPFFNKRRVIALRGKTVLTETRHDQAVPFYLQPVLGGSDDLRGYHCYRFYGNNLLLMNAEYRFETFSGLDTAIFADAGKVFPRRSQLNFKNLESSVGFGLRFNVRNAVFLRIDVGFSHEGWMLWLKFGDVFAKRPIGRSSPESIF